MANPTAPATMEATKAGTWAPVPREALRSFQPDRGGPITAPNDEQLLTDCTYQTQLLTQVEKDAVVTFYRTDCKNGSLRFDMTDPDSAATVEFKFAEPPRPQIHPEKDEYTVSLRLVRFDN